MSCTPQNYPKKNMAPIPNAVDDIETVINNDNDIDTIYNDTIP